MGTGRKFQKKPVTRPTKSGVDRRRREQVQKKRLIALGCTEEQVKHMTTQRIRTLLLRPKTVAAREAQGRK